eukprot:m.116102 g.116102  ORF g.116102 m.116102 type:complete len:199 (-) comp28477_c1_seq1:172-768(-)
MMKISIVLVIAIATKCNGTWVKSSPANPLPKNAVMISNATLNPVPVYECAVNANGSSSKMISGALAYERAWRCVYYDPSSPTKVSSLGPGKYQVFTDTFGDSHGTQATAQKPFPSSAIQPFFSEYTSSTGCQSTYAEIIGGFPYYFPTYGTALPDDSGNFVCFSVSYQLHAEGRFIQGALPYNIAVTSSLQQNRGTIA